MIWHNAKTNPPKETTKKYLVLIQNPFTDHPHTPKYYYKILDYSKDLYNVDDFDFCNKKGKPGWYEYDSEFGYFEVNNVAFWTELPPFPKK